MPQLDPTTIFYLNEQNELRLNLDVVQALEKLVNLTHSKDPIIEAEMQMVAMHGHIDQSTQLGAQIVPKLKELYLNQKEAIEEYEAVLHTLNMDGSKLYQASRPFMTTNEKLREFYSCDHPLDYLSNLKNLTLLLDTLYFSKGRWMDIFDDPQKAQEIYNILQQAGFADIDTVATNNIKNIDVAVSGGGAVPMMSVHCLTLKQAINNGITIKNIAIAGGEHPWQKAFVDSAIDTYKLLYIYHRSDLKADAWDPFQEDFAIKFAQNYGKEIENVIFEPTKNHITEKYVITEHSVNKFLHEMFDLQGAKLHPCPLAAKKVNDKLVAPNMEDEAKAVEQLIPQLDFTDFSKVNIAVLSRAGFGMRQFYTYWPMPILLLNAPFELLHPEMKAKLPRALTEISTLALTTGVAKLFFYFKQNAEKIVDFIKAQQDSKTSTPKNASNIGAFGGVITPSKNTTSPPPLKEEEIADTPIKNTF
ncbi:MAG: hypothetical protein Tsb005_10630 [Gammaproteobacteria bacterium]